MVLDPSFLLCEGKRYEAHKLTNTTLSKPKPWVPKEVIRRQFPCEVTPEKPEKDHNQAAHMNN